MKRTIKSCMNFRIYIRFSTGIVIFEDSMAELYFSVRGRKSPPGRFGDWVGSYTGTTLKIVY